ncbi:hypothetical protein AB0M39_03085 [Streptomyces sp. NPDC051907]|uniref:hypothetical protein n=1 Tax=Streptomyces sp. NPDC051907 TaxID=3155284 RepID=UPI00341619C0
MPPLARSAPAVGADVRPDPATALCDGPRALVLKDLEELGAVIRGERAGQLRILGGVDPLP